MLRGHVTNMIPCKASYAAAATLGTPLLLTVVPVAEYGYLAAL